MSKRGTYWVVGGGKSGELAHCQRCGESLKLGLPQRVAVVCAAMNAFIKAHRACPEPTKPTASQAGATS